MPTPAAKFRRFVAGATTLALCAALATTAAAPKARAADGRELLANAIAGTRGSYLVYNFGAGHTAPMLNAGGSWYEMTSGGHLMIITSASRRLTPRLLVDSHSGDQSRCERDPRARTGEGLFQASKTYSPLQAWQALGQPTIAINANFFDIRGQKGGSWKSTGCSSPLGAYVDNTRGQGRANAPVTGTIAYAGKQGLSGGDETWTALTTMILPVGLGVLAPGDSTQMNDPGPRAARTAIAYATDRDEMYVFQGGSYTPDQIQDLFRGLGSDTAILLDGGGSSAIVLRRDAGMWAGAGVPRGSCDTYQVLCDARERALPSWLAFN